MEDCVRDGLMAEFIRRHGTEVRNMLFTEFNMEDALEVRSEEKFVEGKAEAVLVLLADVGKISPALQKRISSETNVGILDKWLKLAAKSASIEEFAGRMDLV